MSCFLLGRRVRAFLLVPALAVCTTVDTAAVLLQDWPHATHLVCDVLMAAACVLTLYWATMRLERISRSAVRALSMVVNICPRLLTRDRFSSLGGGGLITMHTQFLQQRRSAMLSRFTESLASSLFPGRVRVTLPVCDLLRMLCEPPWPSIRLCASFA